MSSESNPVIISPVGYAKILMHCLKYPHATVNGLLLVKTSSTSSGTSLSQRSSGEGNRVVSESDDTTTNSVGTCSPESSSPSSAVEIVDVVPLFHLGHGLSPMMEVALLQVSSYCKEHQLLIGGYYQANKFFHDSTPDQFAQKVAEKINESNPNSFLLMVSNLGLASSINEVTDAETALHLYTFSDTKWKLKNGLLKLEDCETSFKLVSEFIHDQQWHHDLIDFDNHLDDVSKDWSNKNLNNCIDSFVSSLQA